MLIQNDIIALTVAQEVNNTFNISEAVLIEVEPRCLRIDTQRQHPLEFIKLSRQMTHGGMIILHD
ncbi:hypothetical protein D3C86_1947900 [compost metagenome]